MKKLSNVLSALRKGKFIVVYDGEKREGEADLMFHPKFSNSKKIEKMRKDCGGLICLALGQKIAKKLKLEFMSNILKKSGFKDITYTRTNYGDEPSFSISINHKKVYTGISDKDRAFTLKEMNRILKNKNPERAFKENFRSPGHVFLLIGRGIKKRKGHTELGLELTKMAGMNEAIVMCEMLGKGTALSKKNVIKYATKNRLLFVEGNEIWK